MDRARGAHGYGVARQPLLYIFLTATLNAFNVKEKKSAVTENLKRLDAILQRLIAANEDASCVRADEDKLSLDDLKAQAENSTLTKYVVGSNTVRTGLRKYTIHYRVPLSETPRASSA